MLSFVPSDGPENRSRPSIELAREGCALQRDGRLCLVTLNDHADRGTGHFPSLPGVRPRCGRATPRTIAAIRQGRLRASRVIVRLSGRVLARSPGCPLPNSSGCDATHSAEARKIFSSSSGCAAELSRRCPGGAVRGVGGRASPVTGWPSSSRVATRCQLRVPTSRAKAASKEAVLRTGCDS